ncbi:MULTISPECIES: biliverdin-producing heme oxygenase [Xanthomonas]|uniref:Heme oxygenase n=1 Tax=Xanthomonas phaseoli pv. dieffenbachiae TaxID=92828 RepID=A0A1V9HAM8_9XANT|nr:biliverdin-producing heme oxygenase [Xanthomonas phaseoli]MBO9769035.1 biliverdin-producing heme oxygenase [Xanthomonas phaseoli pv. dieffenbachiae]MBO9777136.1 biliverdin-producing heme oxygenase [Xanthomonas phaseoli pv. dieffenbachiae]MBO9781911.1 biliverdin-producing heme oxygenase [Xanthomonas phaseoli pv. dieffenbachiae]MBO9789610.1 biliverdin-producing heme oxygenase [Xanthomonas phaseoli pv. dieffenbachiae]MBO9794958.1 biliverdin-producing heme oxygenase [Xanthomonas phaseoli pv. di
MVSDVLAVPPSAALALRHATQDAHRLVEAVPLMQALAQGQVDSAAYAQILRRHHALLAGFETQYGNWLTTLVGNGWQYRRRVPALRDDLHALGQQPDLPVALPASAEDAARWGMLYVIEGSQLGGRVIARSLRKQQPALAGALRYFEMADDDPAGWRRFQAALDRRLATPSARDAAIDGAQAMFAHFHACLAAEPQP